MARTGLCGRFSLSGAKRRRLVHFHSVISVNHEFKCARISDVDTHEARKQADHPESGLTKGNVSLIILS